MTLQILSFLMGCVLIGVAVVGGGFELKELKVPRVGYGARAFALFVGLAFIGTGIGLSLVGTERRDDIPTTRIVIDGPGVHAFSTDSIQAAPPPAASSAREVVETQPQRFAGLQGHLRLSWEMSGEVYQAEVVLRGGAGFARVAYATPQYGVLQVDEDLALQQEGDVVMYVGANPRWTANQQPATYYPDYFRVTPTAGGWTIGQICDQTQRCSPVTTEVLP